jgi:hypothetical protein
VPINLGYKENVCQDPGTPGEVRIRVYYDAEFTPVGPDQPLINGPRGFCLDCTNTLGRQVTVQVSNQAGTRVRDVRVGQGDPVANRCLTLDQMIQLGMATRGEVRDFTIICQ